VSAGQLPAIYDVSVGHTRRRPLRNSFRYRTSMWMFDLDRPPRLPGPLRHLARFDPADHLDVVGPLRERGLDVARVVVLANLRFLGYVFNPITVYWCYDRSGRLLADVAEVHNTYGGRFAYELDAGPDDEEVSAVVSKQMYVSPFYPVDGSYRIRISPPGPTVSVAVDLHRPGDQPFRAAMAGRRRPATARNVARSLLRFPLGPVRVRALIQWQGIRLWLRGLEVQPR